MKTFKVTYRELIEGVKTRYKNVSIKAFTAEEAKSIVVKNVSVPVEILKVQLGVSSPQRQGVAIQLTPDYLALSKKEKENELKAIKKDRVHEIHSTEDSGRRAFKKERLKNKKLKKRARRLAKRSSN